MSAAPYWSTDETRLLSEVYPTSTREELSRLFPSRPLHAITVKASKLGLKKRLEFREHGIPFGDSILAHLSEVEKAYLAGIVDGEGCIAMFRRTPSGKKSAVYAFYVSITNTSPQLKEWLSLRFPGQAYFRQSARSNWKPCWSWVISGHRRVFAFLTEIRPYLVIKKEQADIVLQGYLHLSEEDRIAMVDRLRQLKKTA